MLSPFEQATQIQRIDEATFRAEIPDHWQQGRGAFGGLVLGVLARAMVESDDDPARSLRSLTGDLCGPVLPGEALIHVTRLRRGNNLTNLDARLVQQGEVLARASAALGSVRSAVAESGPRGPVVPVPPDWAGVEVVPLGPPLAPVFSQHFEYRLTGPWPLSGGTEAVAEGWLRERVTPSRLDAPAVVGMLDAWWPALYTVESSPRAMATISFTAQVLLDPARLRPEEPMFHRGRVEAARDGFVVEFRELWSGGELVAMNQQTFVILK